MVYPLCYSCLLDQTNSSSDPSQTLILRFPTPRTSLPPSLSLPSFTLANWNPSSTQPSSCSWLVSLFSPTPVNHTPPNVSNLSNHMASQAHQIYYQPVYRSLCVKHATHQKAESLIAAFLSKLDKTVINKSILNTKYPEFFTNGRCSFILTTLIVHTTTPKISPKNAFLYFSQLSPPFYTLTF